MPLYELVLRFDDHEEIRITDAPLEEGQTVSINGNSWRVLEAFEASGGSGPVRLLCVPAGGGFGERSAAAE